MPFFTFYAHDPVPCGMPADCRHIEGSGTGIMQQRSPGTQVNVAVGIQR